MNPISLRPQCETEIVLGCCTLFESTNNELTKYNNIIIINNII